MNSLLANQNRPELVGAVAEVYQSLPEDERARKAEFAGDDGEAARSIFSGRSVGYLPPFVHIRPISCGSPCRGTADKYFPAAAEAVA